MSSKNSIFKKNESHNLSYNSNRVATGNPVVFTLSPPECYMEIRNGYGTSGTRVAGKFLKSFAICEIMLVCSFHKVP